MNQEFWEKKRVFITGHTGFKGSWLCLWLNSLGAEVTGYALEPPTEPSLFNLCKIDKFIKSVNGDVRDLVFLQKTINTAKPEIFIHMAAQPLVRDSYIKPVETYEINVMGTVNVLEAVRNTTGVKAFVNVTTDKCYENKEWLWGYRENEPFGGYDPYSNSKACSELVTAAYRNSFFNPKDYEKHNLAVASARAGNVIGGGDWGKDRLITDCIVALLQGKKIRIRNPNAIRPWQYVLEPLCGYLNLVEKLYYKGPEFSEGWNFGPNDKDARTVQWIVERLCQRWGDGAEYQIDHSEHPHEANYLKLDCSKAKTKLNWSPRWSLDKAIDRIIEWTQAYQDNANVRDICLNQIKEYSSADN
ncbi:MAG: CDP-glucose 4,6-dehydratase [Proteobacteria bacterium]|nr:CDP-glucose 4,6-dehydratase [Pseudomonadota bacterium]MBU1584360.1 CDP-glucose 4,6-dehydratase [Pseudomonadota bacterium]